MTSIRVKLTLWYALLLFVTLTLFGCALYIGMTRVLRDQVDASLEVLMSQLISESEFEDDGEFDTETELIPPGDALAIYNSDGTLLTVRGMIPTGPPQAPGFDTFQQADHDWRRLTSEGLRPGMRFQISRSLEPLERTTGLLFLLLLFGVPATTVLAGAGGLFLASRLLNPLEDITRTASALSADDLSARLAPLETDDELSRLVDTFNDMLKRLEESFLRQRQFTSDAAHELRTPLSILLARAEVTLDRERTVPEYEESLEEIKSTADNMSKLVSKLLLLARADARTLPLDLESIDLAELAQDSATTMKELFPEIVWKVELAPAPVLGDQTRLTELIWNLLENAASFTPSGGWIQVRSNTDKGHAVLQVVDSGPGIPDAHLLRIFDRFYQADSSRTRTKGRSGSGLGLAICRTIAEQHQGQIAAANSPQGGAVFTLRIPLP